MSCVVCRSSTSRRCVKVDVPRQQPLPLVCDGAPVTSFSLWSRASQVDPCGCRGCPRTIRQQLCWPGHTRQWPATCAETGADGWQGGQQKKRKTERSKKPINRSDCPPPRAPRRMKFRARSRLRCVTRPEGGQHDYRALCAGASPHHQRLGWVPVLRENKL